MAEQHRRQAFGHRQGPGAGPIGNLDSRSHSFDPGRPGGAHHPGQDNGRTPIARRALEDPYGSGPHGEVHQEGVVGRHVRAAIRGSEVLTRSNSPKVHRIWSMICDPWAAIQPPPRSTSAHQPGTTAAGSASRGTWSTTVARRGSPISPELTVWARRACPASHRNSHPSRWTAPAAASVTRPSSASRAKGFSQMTCFPAAMAASAITAWVWGGVAMATASTPRGRGPHPPR